MVHGQPLAVAGGGEGGAVADREHVLGRGPQPVVGGDRAPRVEGDPGAGQPAGVWTGADADHHHVRAQLGAVGQPDRRAGRAGGPVEAAHADAGAQLDAGLGVPGPGAVAELGRERAGQWRAGRLDHGDGAAELPGDGRGLRADPARADDHHPRAGAQRGLEPERVVVGAQQVGVGGPAGQRDRGRAGGEDQPVVGQFAPLGAQQPPVAVEAEGGPAEPQFDPQLVVVDLEAGVLGLAEEHVLGERRTVVGRVRLGPEQYQAAAVAALAQRDGGLQPRRPGPHHDDPLHCRLLGPAPRGAPARNPASGPGHCTAGLAPPGSNGERLQWVAQSREPGVPG